MAGQAFQNNICYAQLPKAGLGNMLFVWARARVFAHINQIGFVHSNWMKFRLGPIIRRERSWRFYYNFFQSGDLANPIQNIAFKLLYNRVIEPPIQKISLTRSNRTVYTFREIPHWNDYFGNIRPYRDFIRNKLYEMLTDKTRLQLNSQNKPVIAVHVRMGDFRKVQTNDNFAFMGHARTPLNHFTSLIANIRQVHGQLLPVTVFSDGQDEEIADLLELPAVSRSQRNSDIVDLLLMAQCKLLLLSASSSFSYWAGFLADAPILLHPQHVHAPIRPDNVNCAYYEGGVDYSPDTWPHQLINNIKTIQFKHS